MLKGLIIFAAGVYSGIYVAQNYDVPKVDEPTKLFEETVEKLKKFADENKKKPETTTETDGTVKIIEKTLDLVKTLAEEGKKK
ncbi:uncharacterized protein LOC134828817 [Culicoides brevitarsis]|uniref:uncharacterized protein LOC134828817 n=1 Tax=Culicoides brevitarsis TaxID=469753 RepID=UPI00307C4876